jgi:hypothetical protein
MLHLLPRLPFECAIDILFRHGGIALGLGRVFRSGVLLLKFLRCAFANDPLFAEVVCACHLVFCLECPADALHLLLPIDKTIPESVGAWSVSSAHSDADWILPVRRDLMMRAMRAFVARGPIYDWLDASDLGIKRTVAQWVEFAAECAAHHHFTARWWRVFADEDEETMACVILKRAEAEMARLNRGLWHDECRRMMGAKRERREAADAKAKKIEAESNKTEAKKEDTKVQPKTQMRSLSSATKLLKLTVVEETSAKANAEQLSLRHRNLLKEMGVILNDRISTFSFDANLAKIARYVMSLANEYARIRWALKALFHKAAGDRLGMEVWHVERLLCVQATFRSHEPLDKLRRMR